MIGLSMQAASNLATQPMAMAAVQPFSLEWGLTMVAIAACIGAVAIFCAHYWGEDGGDGLKNTGSPSTHGANGSWSPPNNSF